MNARIPASAPASRFVRERAYRFEDGEPGAILTATLAAQGADDLAAVWTRIKPMFAPEAAQPAVLFALVAEWSHRAEAVGLTPTAHQLLALAGSAPDGRTCRACVEASS